MWVLVHWVDTNQTSVLTEDMVTDKTMLDNSEKVGMVKHGSNETKPPKHGWKAYTAKIIARSGKKSDIVIKEGKFIKELADNISVNVVKEGAQDRLCKFRLKRTHSAAQKDSSSDESTQGGQIKSTNTSIKMKKMAAERNRMNKLIEASKAAIASSSDEEVLDDMTHTQLIKRVKDLENKLELANKIPKFHEDMQRTVSEEIFKSLNDIKKSKAGLLQPLMAAAPISRAHEDKEIGCGSKGAVEQQNDAKLLDITITQAIQTEIVNYIPDDETLLHIKRSKDANKMICNLMTAMFTTEEMLKCLVTGKRIKQEDKDRNLLDQEKVNAIVKFVNNYYPNIPESTIRSKMACKCKDTRHAARRLEEKEKLKELMGSQMSTS